MSLLRYLSFLRAVRVWRRSGLGYMAAFKAARRYCRRRG